MSIKPYLTREASHDLDEIQEYISRDNVEAARRVLAKIFDRIAYVANNPDSGMLYESIDTPIRFVTSGNYVIYFTLSESTLRIIRVLHGARDSAQLLPPEGP